MTIVNDPGHGFGEAARACALREPCEPAKDAAGRPVAAETKAFRVRFER